MLFFNWTMVNSIKDNVIEITSPIAIDELDSGNFNKNSIDFKIFFCLFKLWTKVNLFFATKNASVDLP